MIKQKRIAFFGTGGVFSNIVLKSLINNGINISLVVILVKQNSKLQPLNELTCLENKIHYIKIQNTNTEFVKNILVEKKIDLGIVASYSQILKSMIIESVQDGFVNVHPSFLPFYRGANPIFWQIKDLKDEFGVTVHKINEGIDEGEILSQSKVILDDLYSGNDILKKIAILGSELLISVVNSYILKGKLESSTKEKNDLEKGFYNHKPKEEDFEINPLDIHPIQLSKLVSRIKKWGYFFMYYENSKVYFDSIEEIDLNEFGKDIIRINNTKLKVKSTQGSFIIKIKEI